GQLLPASGLLPDPALSVLSVLSGGLLFVDVRVRLSLLSVLPVVHRRHGKKVRPAGAPSAPRIRRSPPRAREPCHGRRRDGRFAPPLRPHQRSVGSFSRCLFMKRTKGSVLNSLQQAWIAGCQFASARPPALSASHNGFWMSAARLIWRRTPSLMNSSKIARARSGDS